MPDVVDVSHGPSDVNGPERAFARLGPSVQKWVWDQGWGTLRSVQALAVDPILDGRDVLISAATAAGKTEAAWLPVASSLAASSGERTGVQALYLSPLKALINDQYMRLESLGQCADIPVHRWHGDVPASAKKTLRTQPRGILLITPESLEAMFVREGPGVGATFAGLSYIVVDEFHSFIGSERGAQLQSLMHRLELAVRRRVSRIGLSATLADLSDAAEYLRPGCGQDVARVEDPHGERTEVLMQVRGYVRTRPRTPPSTVGHGLAQPSLDLGDSGDTEHSDAAQAIGQHLLRALRGADNLIFANSRASVEAYTDILTGLCADLRVPNEFHAHHGNLSKQHREDVEARLRSSDSPATAVCTSTLEMGIDIGSTDSVAQVGAPPSVAALRQRLGRSGRRGKPATLRTYIAEDEITAETPPADSLRSELMQTLAMTDLMLVDRWYEAPNLTDLHLSTLIQQTLSVIAQHGGATAAQLYSALCGDGPFGRVSSDLYLRLLRDMGGRELLIQSGDGLLLAGRVGDRLVNHYSFYSAFKSVDEYRLMAQGTVLGSIPVTSPVLVGSYLIFAGLRWQIVEVDQAARVIELTRSAGGRPPSFDGNGAEISDEVRKRMRRLYEDSELPRYLDATGQELVIEGRQNYQNLRLSERLLIPWGNETSVLPWRGDRILNTVAVALASAGLRVAKDGVGLTVKESPTAVSAAARQLALGGEPDPTVLAESVAIKVRDKYDEYLSDHLLSLTYASHAIDVHGAWEVLGALAGEATTSLPYSPPSVPVDDPGDRASIGVTPFAVIDVETTGFAPQDGDRIIEIAIFQADPWGVPTGSWSTLINPDRGVGPTQIHGLSVEDLASAPRWAAVAEWVRSQLAGRIVVAHNAGFDLRFINAEYLRMQETPPSWPTLDTMAVASALGNDVDRSLHSCCSKAGIELRDAHSAEGDAHGTLLLLGAYLEEARKKAVSLDHLLEGRRPAAQPRKVPDFPAISPRRL